MNRVPNPDEAFESLLTDALTTRSRGARQGSGSLGDVRSRARRRARRRTVTGAGALAVLGSIGAVVALTRDDEPATFRLLAGGDAAPPVSGGRSDGEDTVWQCTGMVSAPSPATILAVPTTIAIDPTTVVIDPTTTAIDPATTVVIDTTTIVPAPSTTVEGPLVSTTVETMSSLTSVLPTSAPNVYLMTGCTPTTMPPPAMPPPTTVVETSTTR